MIYEFKSGECSAVSLVVGTRGAKKYPCCVRYSVIMCVGSPKDLNMPSLALNTFNLILLPMILRNLLKWSRYSKGNGRNFFPPRIVIKLPAVKLGCLRLKPVADKLPELLPKCYEVAEPFFLFGFHEEVYAFVERGWISFSLDMSESLVSQ